MRRNRLTRGAVGVAALCLVIAGCATPRAPEGPRDVRVVDLSDEAAEKIAERVAAYIPKQPTMPAAVHVQGARAATVPTPVRVQVQPPQKRPDYSGVFGPVVAVPPDRLRSTVGHAVDESLEWLARHQSKDGAWNAAAFADQCPAERCSGAGEASYTPGLTGMALLAFLGNGETHRTGAHAEVVQRGLQYLRTIQDSEGCFGPRTSQHFQYNHALCSLAMVEAYGLTKSPLFAESAQSAVDFVLRSQNPYLGWRYGIRDGDNDTSMTAWMVMVLASAKQAGLRVDDGAFRGAHSWVDKMTEPEFGRVGYNRRGGPTARTQDAMDAFPSELSEAMTAAGLLIRIHSGESPQTSELIKKGADLLAAKPPVWNIDRGTNDFYYWHLGTMAMARIGGPGWEKWKNALHAAVVEHQRSEDGGVGGSWDPVDAWSKEGGRVYATATLCLTLETLLRSAK